MNGLIYFKKSKLKRFKLVLWLGITGVLLSACQLQGDKSFNQSDPVAVVERIFEAARSQDLSLLVGLCASEGEEEMQLICSLQEESDEVKRDFYGFFEKGKVIGKAEIDGAFATVSFVFGPGGETEEQMRLIRIGDKWFLYAF